LKHEADVVAAIAGQLGLTGCHEVMVAPPRVPARGVVKPSKNIEECRLARARWAQQYHELALVDVEVHVT
jgi:hypothetical protein